MWCSTDDARSRASALLAKDVCRHFQQHNAPASIFFILSLMTIGVFLDMKILGGKKNEGEESWCTHDGSLVYFPTIPGYLLAVTGDVWFDKSVTGVNFTRRIQLRTLIQLIFNMLPSLLLPASRAKDTCACTYTQKAHTHTHTSSYFTRVQRFFLPAKKNVFLIIFLILKYLMQIEIIATLSFHLEVDKT